VRRDDEVGVLAAGDGDRDGRRQAACGATAVDDLADRVDVNGVALDRLDERLLELGGADGIEDDEQAGGRVPDVAASLGDDAPPPAEHVMRLTSLSYVQFPADRREWKLSGLKLGALNLIVGKNASGRTRTVNVLWTLARLLCGTQKPTLSSAEYEARFEHDGEVIDYVLRVKDSVVTEERFAVAGEVKLTRGSGGEGQIWASKLGQYFEFQSPQNELATEEGGGSRVCTVRAEKDKVAERLQQARGGLEETGHVERDHRDRGVRGVACGVQRGQHR
jgi:hypothetical protein